MRRAPLILGIVVALATGWWWWWYSSSDPTVPPPPPPPPDQFPTIMIGDLRFVQLPVETVMLGSLATELGRRDNEHRIEFTGPAGIYLGETEITVGQYWHIVDPARTISDSEANLPMTGISWQEAVEFCQLLSKKYPDYAFRLPRETEWEYACRGGLEEMYGCWDEEVADAATRWTQFGDERKLPRVLRTRFQFDKDAPVNVKSFSANAYGLYDMHGNVHEWCEHDDSFPELNDAASLSDRPIRGGGYSSSTFLDCRAARRAAENRAEKSASIGFRVAMEVL